MLDRKLVFKILKVVCALLIFGIAAIAKDGGSTSSRWDIIALDAKYSSEKQDYYQSYRLLEFLKTKAATSFYHAENLSLYLQNLAILGSNKKREKFCKTESAKRKKYRQQVIYYCAKSYYQTGEFRRAYSWIQKLEKKLRNDASRILEASILLALANPEKCLDKIFEVDPAPEFSDLVYITKARCHMAMNRFELASAEFQKIAPESPHYMDSLIDLSWAYFKGRQIGDTKTTIDVVLSSFEEFSEDQKKIDSLEYFQLRYLKAYLGVLQRGASDVKLDMNLAASELVSLKNKFQLSGAQIKKFAAKVTNKKNRELLNPIWRGDRDWYEFLMVWSNPNLRNRTMKELRHLKAVQNELHRKTTKGGYRASLVKLEKTLRDTSKLALEKLYKRSLESLDGFDFRVNLAKLKVDTLTKTKGAQNLKQATEIYKRKENYLQNLVGGVQ